MAYTIDTYDVLSDIPECPLIVFINSRSGGQLGSRLTLALNRSLGRPQVRGEGSRGEGLWVGEEKGRRKGGREGGREEERRGEGKGREGKGCEASHIDL